MTKTDSYSEIALRNFDFWFPFQNFVISKLRRAFLRNCVNDKCIKNSVHVLAMYFKGGGDSKF